MSKFRLIFEPPSLCRLSEVRVCKNIWFQYEVRKTMRELLENSSDDPLDFDNEGTEILKQVNNNIDKLLLPIEIKSELKTLAKDVGTVIWKWLKRMNQLFSNMSENFQAYIDHIKWTGMGNIDSIETLRSMYYSRVLPDSWDTWNNLNCYCLEDCSLDFVKGKGKKYGIFSPIVKEPRKPYISCDSFLMAYWTARIRNKLNKFTANLNDKTVHRSIFYDKSDALNVNMLRMGIWNYNFPATKYFWESLTEEQRISTFSKVSQGLPNCRDKPIRCMDVIFYLWKQVPVYGDDKFFIHILLDKEVMHQMFQWPWEHFFMKTLEGAWPRLDESDLRKMLDNISICIHNSGGGNSNFVKIFNDIWIRMDDDSKKSLKVIGLLIGDVECLKIVINDPVFIDDRRNLLSQVADAFGWKMAHLESVMIAKFCEKVLKDQEERVWFRTQCSLHAADYKDQLSSTTLHTGLFEFA